MMGGPDGGPQGSDDNTAALGVLPPDHPLLQRAQQALRKQLQQTLQDVNAQLREKKQALKACP